MCTNHAYEAAIGEAASDGGWMPIAIQYPAEAPQVAESVAGGYRLVRDCDRWEFPDRSSRR